MGCTLEVALPSVKTRESDGNVRFDTCVLYPCICMHAFMYAGRHACMHDVWLGQV